MKKVFLIMVVLVAIAGTAWSGTYSWEEDENEEYPTSQQMQEQEEIYQGRLIQAQEQVREAEQKARFQQMENENRIRQMENDARREETFRKIQENLGNRQFKY